MNITLTGIDEATDLVGLLDLAHPSLEIGILLSVNPEGRNRYPSTEWIQYASDHLKHTLSLSLHVCGKARTFLLQRKINLVENFKRIQVNGILSYADVKSICNAYPDKTIITQHHNSNRDLLRVKCPNHAVLIDGSGGRGISPTNWVTPKTHKQVGFAGGLGPDNLETELLKIQRLATKGAWIDMEGKLRDSNDRFSLRCARDVLKLHEIYLTSHKNSVPPLSREAK